LDRIDKFELGWSNKDLLNMLNIRLKSFSTPGNQVSYNEFICPMSIKYFENNILYYSARSPRNLLKLVNYIIMAFQEIKNENQDKIKCIDEKAIKEGIRLFYKDRLWESDSELYIARLKDTIRDYDKNGLYLPYYI
jgi:hypothetical protein